MVVAKHALGYAIDMATPPLFEEFHTLCTMKNPIRSANRASTFPTVKEIRETTPQTVKSRINHGLISNFFIMIKEW